VLGDGQESGMTTEAQTAVFVPGYTDYGATLRAMAPDLWADVFCPSGEYHAWRKKLLRKPICTQCRQRRSWRA
jgi:hypothetical protein